VRKMLCLLSDGRRHAILACAMLGLACCATGTHPCPIPVGTAPAAKNVVVLIADGCGYNQVAAARCYQSGATGADLRDTFKTYGMSTFPKGGRYNPRKAWRDFNYVDAFPTDSAAAATAMATGRKTKNGALGVDAKGNILRNLVEYAESLGKSTGVVTTVPLSHATPAGFVAHVQSRGDYATIGEYMIRESALEVLMGAGHPWYDNDGRRLAREPDAKAFQYVGGRQTWESLQTNQPAADADGDGTPDPWTFIDTREGIRALAEGPAPRRLLGLAPIAQTLQQSRSGDVNAAPGVVPRPESVPTLAEFTRAALNVLEDNPRGYFLMIEGGAVDWASHSNQTGRMIEEMIDFNEAVAAVAEWVDRHDAWGDTLVIVTGDHETGYPTGPGSNPAWHPVQCRGKGQVPGMEWHAKGHTNNLIPFSVRGAGASRAEAYAVREDPVRGRYIDNTELARIVFDVLE